jgi:hypothetical protein
MRLLPTKGVDATPFMQYMSHEDDDDPASSTGGNKSPKHGECNEAIPPMR